MLSERSFPGMVALGALLLTLRHLVPVDASSPPERTVHGNSCFPALTLLQCLSPAVTHRETAGQVSVLTRSPL